MTGTKQKRTFTNWRIGLIVVFTLSVVLYLPSLMGGAIWDDVDLISGAAFHGNSLKSAFTHPFLGHYFRPLTSVSFVIDSNFAKETPFFYHQTNILLHALTAVLVALIGFQITRKPLAGVLSGLFFVVQPLQVGAAAWIGGRTDVLSAFFLAGFIAALIQFYQTEKRGWLYASALIWFLAALSKEQAAASLIAVPLSVYALGSRQKKDIWPVMKPFTVILVIYILLWCVGAPAPYGAHNGLLETISTALRTTSHYGLSLLTPTKAPILTFTLENMRTPIGTLVGALLVGGFVWGMMKVWKDHKPFAWVVTCGLLVYMPVSNFPTVPSFVVGPYRCAEAGTAAAVALGVIAAYGFTSRKYWLAGLLLANLAACTYITDWGVRQFTTPLNFFTKAAQLDPHFIVGVGNYAHALDLEERSPESLALTDRTLTWIFGTPQWKPLLQKEGWDALTPEVRKTLRTNGGIPDIKALGWFISCNAASLSNLNRKKEATEVSRIAVTIAPTDARINFQIGQLLLDTDRATAIKYWEKAIKIIPTFSACAQALAHERVKDGRYQDALDLLNKAVKDIGWNGNVWMDIAEAKAGLHDYHGALKALDKAGETMFAASKVKIAERRKQFEALLASQSKKSP